MRNWQKASAWLGVVLLAAWAAVPIVQADVIVETEINGAATNNTTGSAQAIPGSAFTTPLPATVFDPPAGPTATITGRGGSEDVDFFSLLLSGGDIMFDIDNDPFTFDMILSLFDSGGTLLALDDDSFPADPGSESGLDAFLGVYTLPGPGTYYIAVSEFANFPSVAFDCASISGFLVRPDGGGGGPAFSGCPEGDSSFPVSGEQAGSPYTLHISLNESVAPVPEPGTLLLLGTGLAGIGRRAWKKRRG